jgi:hypothetical protein
MNPAIRRSGDPGTHGTIAWQQGYQLLIYHLRLFEDLHQDHGMAEMLFVASVSHRFLDDLMISITDEFLSAQLDVNEEKWRRRVRKSGDSPTPTAP